MISLLPYLALAFAGGIVIALQAPVNARLGTVVGGPVWAAVVSFAVGTVCLVVWQLVSGAPVPDFANGLAGPWWLWVGGFLGAYYVAISAFVVPRLGVALLMAAAITGQLLFAMLLDHFGLLVAEVRPLSELRLLGAGCLFAGVWLVLKY